ncbi:ATP-binding cassette domain-containing protein [Nostoc sp. NIES-2111]
MREDLLVSLMQLFAILGKLEQTPGAHREVVSHFLTEQLAVEESDHWLALYDEFLATLGGRSTATAHGAHLTVKDSSRLLRICMQINEELGQRQKAMVLFILFSFLNQNHEHISAEEHEFLASVADIFNVTQREFAQIEAFALGRPLPGEDAAELLTIANHNEEIQQGKVLVAEEVEGRLAVLRMAAIGMYLVRYQGKTPMYLNGVAMRDQRIYSLENGASLRGSSSKITPIYYSDIVSKFAEDKVGHTLTFEARDVTFRFPNGRQGLHGISFAEEAGHMIGLMGPSGAGKSTLLEVLNGNLRPTTGQVLINGKDLYGNKGLFKGVIGYVPQDDLLIEELTVEQNLFYAAKLSMGSYSETQLHELVAKTLDSLGLSHIGHLRVGSPMAKTISGGERKRVNIGLELLRAPQVLFVDEPTSGLSSRDSLNVMELLKSLTEQGKLVFVVIHQPSSDIYKMFDRLCILDTGGYPIYYGNPVEAIRYFKARAGIINKDQALCHDCGNVNPEQVFDIVETRVVDEYGRYLNKRRYSPIFWYEQYKQYITPPSIKVSVGKFLTGYKKAPILRQLVTFIQRDVLSKLHNQQYLAINLLEAPALAVLLAYVFRYYKVDELTSSGYVYQDNENIVVYLFISVIVALFLGLTVSAEEIFKDRRILKRESFLHLSRHAYFTSKVLILFTLSAIQTALFALIGNSILEVGSLGWQTWAILFSTACFANMLGLNISSAFNSAVTIYILIPIILIPQLVMGGLVIKFDQINPELRHGDAVPVYGEIMASRWAFEALSVNQFKDNPHAAPLYPYDRVMAQADYKRQYLLPVLEGKIEYCDLHAHSRDTKIIAQVDRELHILCRTLTEEVGRHPKLNLEPPCGLSFANYSLAEGVKLHGLIQSLKDRYADIYNDAARRRDLYVQAQMRTPAAAEAYVDRARRLTNNGLAELVKNTRSQERIAQEGDRLVQKISPVYHVPERPAHWYDFRTHFFAPQKHFAGHWWDTFYFNLAVIWLMSGLLYATLYHGTLSRLIKGLEGLRKRS